MNPNINIEIYINKIIQFILSPDFSGPLFFVRLGFILISLFFLGFITFSFMKTAWLKRLILWDIQEILTFKPFGLRRIVKQWNRIKARMDTGLERDFKMAIIEADTMLDDTLKRMGFAGVSLGERLEKLTAASLSNIEEVKTAHKTRNSIVHDPDYKLARDEAKNMVEIYEKALTDLQAL